MREDGAIGMPFGSHHGGADLAEAHAMSPACAGEAEASRDAVMQVERVDHEGRAIEMRLGERAADLQLLTDDICAPTADDPESHDAPRSAALDGLQVEDSAEVDAALAADQVGKLVLRVLHRPAIEVGRLEVVVVEHLAEDALVRGVTESLGGGADPAIGFGLVRQVGHRGVWRATVAQGDEITVMNRLPAVLEALRNAAARLREACIAKPALVREHLATGGPDGLLHGRCRGACDALITLAMVVGADVEARVILAVVPSDETLVVLAAALRLGVDRRLSLFDLCQQPAARDDGVRAE